MIVPEDGFDVSCGSVFITSRCCGNTVGKKGLSFTFAVRKCSCSATVSCSTVEGAASSREYSATVGFVTFKYGEETVE